MTLCELVDTRIRRAMQVVRRAFRARLTSINPQPGVQLVQCAALAGERLQAVELMQHFGFTSAPPAGTQLIVLPVAGRTTCGVIVATENGAYRVAVEQGETCVYNQSGAKITLKKDRRIEIECDSLSIKAKNEITLETKALAGKATTGISMQSPSHALSGVSGAAAQTTMTGSLTTSGDVIAAGISLDSHTHAGDSGGTTSGPR